MQAHLKCGAALEPDAVLAAPVNAERYVNRCGFVADDRAKKAVRIRGSDDDFEAVQIRAKIEINVTADHVDAETGGGRPEFNTRSLRIAEQGRRRLGRIAKRRADARCGWGRPRREWIAHGDIARGRDRNAEQLAEVRTGAQVELGRRREVDLQRHL
jgi:hypothetical protein